MKRRDLIQHLEGHGCRFLREGSNHTACLNPGKRKVSTVPRHREINEDLARKVCRDLEIPQVQMPIIRAEVGPEPRRTNPLVSSESYRRRDLSRLSLKFIGNDIEKWTSFLRKQESRWQIDWMPAFAGMTTYLRR